MEFNIRVRTGRDGDHWIAAATIETPAGPLVVTASASQSLIEAALAHWRRRHRVRSVVGAFDGFGELAKKVAKAHVVEKAQDAAQAVAKSPAVARTASMFPVRPADAANALRGIATNPSWSPQGGLSRIPGLSHPVTAGLAAAAATGRGTAGRDVAIARARHALTNPTLQTAFDVGIGLGKAQRLSRADVDRVRGQLPGVSAPGTPAARAKLIQSAFDAALTIARSKTPDRAALSALKNRVGPAPSAQELARLAEQTVQRRHYRKRATDVLRSALRFLEKIEAGDGAARSSLETLTTSASRGDKKAKIAVEVMKVATKARKQNPPKLIASAGAWSEMQDRARRLPAYRAPLRVANGAPLL